MLRKILNSIYVRMVTTAIMAMVLLVFIPKAEAKQIFYNSLDSDKAVSDGGGKVHAGSFVQGALDNGFLAEKAGEAVSFPTEEQIQLEVGSIALWVKVMIDITKVPGESFIFMEYKRGNDAFFINHSHAWNANGICWMIKNSGQWHAEGKGKSCSQDLDWKTDETHFIVTTWGPKGMMLFLDGELAGHVDDHKTGPALMDDDFWIGNIEIEKGSTLPSQWVVDELYIFDTQLEEAEVQGLMKSSLAVEADDKLATTWGNIKNDR